MDDAKRDTGDALPREPSTSAGEREAICTFLESRGLVGIAKRIRDGVHLDLGLAKDLEEEPPTWPGTGRASGGKKRGRGRRDR